MSRFLSTLFSLFFATVSFAQNYDIVVVGGTPGGITAAIAAAREGRTVLLLERTSHIGGLPANGLGATDIKTTGATTGLFKEFTNAVVAHYSDTYGATSKQKTDSANGLHFEPRVAEQIFEQMLAAHNDKITVLKMRQFDCAPENIVITNGAIQSIKVKNRADNSHTTYTAKIFIDATYEGDLAAAAGVPFRIGREGKTEFNEAKAGVLYEAYKGGPEHPDSTHAADDRLQAYNYRICLTNAATNRVAIPKPSVYNRDEYVSLIEDLLNCNMAITAGTNNTADNFTTKFSQAKRAQHRANLLAGGNGKVGSENGAAGGSKIIDDFVWGISVVVSCVTLPNEKRDANNQHTAFLSTDLPEENYAWPTATWEWRDNFAERLKNYNIGLLWFVQNDTALPERFRTENLAWGFAADEYTDNNNFPRQVYVREGRRFMGKYFFTENDALKGSATRPPIHEDSVTASHYHLDSHAVRKRQPNHPDYPHLDGFFSKENQPYTVPFGVMLPDLNTANINNLIFPVPVSGSHIGFSTLRMEPCWMALGQAAGTAAALAIHHNCAVEAVPLTALQKKLANAGATLIYFTDVSANDPDFAAVQWAGLRGFFSRTFVGNDEQHLGLDVELPSSGRNKWVTLTDYPIPTTITKRAALRAIYAHEMGKTAAKLAAAEMTPTSFAKKDDTAEFTFLRQHAEFVYNVESSFDLKNWTVLEVNPGKVGENVTVIIPLGEEKRRFFRLRIVSDE